MTPAAFLALTRGHATPGGARGYRAMVEGSGGGEAFLTLHMTDGKCHALAYAQLALVTGDERGGTFIRLMFKATTLLHGRQLQSVCDAVLARRAAHLYEFDGGRHDPPEPGQPVITKVEFQLPQARAAGG